MEVDVGKVLGYVQSGHGERHLEGARVGYERDWRVVQTASIVAEAPERDLDVSVGHVKDLQLPEAAIRVSRVRGRASGPSRVQVRFGGTSRRFTEAHIVQAEADTFAQSGLEAIQASEVLCSTASVQEDVPWGLHFSAAVLEDTGAEWWNGGGGLSVLDRLLGRPFLAAQGSVHELVVERELGGIECGAGLRLEFNFLEKRWSQFVG